MVFSLTLLGYMHLQWFKYHSCQIYPNSLHHILILKYDWFYFSSNFFFTYKAISEFVYFRNSIINFLVYFPPIHLLKSLDMWRLTINYGFPSIALYLDFLIHLNLSWQNCNHSFRWIYHYYFSLEFLFHSTKACCSFIFEPASISYNVISIQILLSQYCSNFL